MNSKTLIRKALSLCLIVAVYATYSMVALAGGEKIAAELTVAGKSSSVRVNGQEAQSGRTIVSSSTIATPADSSAVVSIGKLGKIELAPNTVLTLKFDESGISGDLANGKVTVLGAKDNVNISTASGKSVSLTAGKSVSAGAQDDDDDDDDNGAWWIWTLVFGGAIAAVVIAATSDNNRVNLGGSGTVVSPSR